MSSVTEISLTPIRGAADDTATVDQPVGSAFGEPAMRDSRGRRASPTLFVVLGLLAGVCAMALGAMAVVSAGRAGSDTPTAALEPSVESSARAIEQRVLALLAKPSTERVVFRGTGGRLVLAVGSGGRAAILARAFPRVEAGRPYSAWVVRSGKWRRAARFVGSERVVLLSTPVGRGESVVVSSERPGRVDRARIVALRR